MKIPQSVREVIEKGPLAHLTTLNSKGGPQVTVVWVGIENDEFVIGHLAVHQKVKNIRRDARVALSLLSDKTNPQGLREYLVAYGNARVTEGGAVALLQHLAPILSRTEGRLPARRDAQHPGVHHPNRTGAIRRGRPVDRRGGGVSRRQRSVCFPVLPVLYGAREAPAACTRITNYCAALCSTVITSPGITRRIPNSDGSPRLTR